jgi:DNA-directed RNA polymerase subunit beta
MTTRGTFIVNGVERVVVSQLVRSAGVYFTATPYRGRQLFGAKIIPEPRRMARVRDRHRTVRSGLRSTVGRKVPVTDMLRIFGMDTRTDPRGVRRISIPGWSVIDATFKKDVRKMPPNHTYEIYKPFAPGRPGERRDRKEP